MGCFCCFFGVFFFLLTGRPIARHVEFYIPLLVGYVSGLTCSGWFTPVLLPCASLRQCCTCHNWNSELPLFQDPVHLTSAVRNKSGIRRIVYIRLPLDFLLRITEDGFCLETVHFQTIYNAQDNRLGLPRLSSSSTLGVTGRDNSFSSYGWRKINTVHSWSIPALWIFKNSNTKLYYLKAVWPSATWIHPTQTQCVLLFLINVCNNVLRSSW